MDACIALGLGAMVCGPITPEAAAQQFPAPFFFQNGANPYPVCVQVPSTFLSGSPCIPFGTVDIMSRRFTFSGMNPAANQTGPGNQFVIGTDINGNLTYGPISNSALPNPLVISNLQVLASASGAGLTAFMASPPAIGSTAPSTGAFTSLSASGTVSGTGFSSYLAAPPPIGNVTPSTGAFTALSASGTVSGAGFTTFMASPPAIGSTAPSTGVFTTFSATNGTFSGTLDVTGAETFAAYLRSVSPITNAAIIDLYTSPPVGFSGMTGNGAIFSINPTGGHVAGDTLRTADFIRMTTSARANPDPVSAQEFGTYVDVYNQTGAVNSWQATTAYSAGAYVHSAGTGWTYQTNANCTSGAGPGPNETGTPSPQTDGTCSWNAVTAGLNDGKTALGLNNTLAPGGGHTWVQANNLFVKTGGFPSVGGFVVNTEMDMNNTDRDCPPGIPGGCQAYILFLNGAGYTGKANTVGIFGAGNGSATPLTHWGVYLAPGFAKDLGLIESTDATVGVKQTGVSAQTTGIQQTGTQTTAGMSLESTTPVAVLAKGTNSAHSFAVTATTAVGYDISGSSGSNAAYNATGNRAADYLSQSTSNVAFQATGTYAVAAFIGATYQITPTTFAGLGTCNATHDGVLRYITDSNVATFATLITAGGGANKGLALCVNGTGWVFH